MHWLPTWKENSHAPRATAGRQEQGRGRLALGAELAAERVGRPVCVHGQPYDQGEIASPARRFADLVQLFRRVEREDPHAEVMVGARDRRAALHRVHEGHPGAGRVRRDQRHLTRRGNVERLDPGAMQGADQPWRRIGLHRIEDIALEVSPEPARRQRRRSRPRQGDRMFGRPLADQVQGVMVGAQRTLPPADC